MDHYEAKQRYGKIEVVESGESVYFLAKSILDQMTVYNRDLRSQMYSRLNRFSSDVHWTEDVLPRTLDDYHLSIPKDCELEQAALLLQPHLTQKFRFRVNTEIWSSMNRLNQASLIAHEVLYSIAIDFSSEPFVFDASPVRYLVGLALGQRVQTE
ncbi:MAG: hypothetical protein AAF202_12230, partial [Pseudomonadota bacterium]